MKDLKKCFVCEIEKNLNQFYKHSQMKDGYTNKCKSCTKQQSKENYNKKMKDPDFVEKERERGRAKKRPTHKSTIKQNSDYKKKYPEKYRAHYYVARITKKEGYHFHHWSYNEEHFRDYIELSIKEHNKAHRFIIYDQERMMYRKLDGELLDTKEKHNDYIMEMIKTKKD